ncbi:MAG: MBL fold metallo-hydrolase [Pyrinomonadaceae bacterium]
MRSFVLGISVGVSYLALISNSTLPQTRPSAAARQTEIVMLGTGTPRPDPNAWGPSTAIIVGKRVFLIDAGVGIERRLAAANLPINGVTAAFITHLHSDHVLGLPDLIFTSWIYDRSTPFPVYGPRGLDHMTKHLYAAFAEDIRIRTEGLEHAPRGGYRVDVHEIKPGVVYDDDGVRVTAFRVAHGAWRDAFGYRFDTPDRSIVISGDTSPSEELVKMATGVDVLIHEVQPTNLKRITSRPDWDWPKYVSQYHTTAIQLGQIAARAQPKLLIVYHNGRRVPASELIADIRRSFAGQVVVADDLQRF